MSSEVEESMEETLGSFEVVTGSLDSSVPAEESSVFSAELGLFVEFSLSDDFEETLVSDAGEETEALLVVELLDAPPQLASNATQDKARRNFGFKLVITEPPYAMNYGPFN
jgi:hypothetical protein